MAYEIYQSRFTGAKIDENLGKVATLEEKVTDLEREYDASKIKMADGSTLPNYLNNTKFDIQVSSDDDNILEKTVNGYKVAEKPDYVLPKATATTLGGIKVDGDTIDVDANGVVSAKQYVLPKASQSTLGGVKVDGSTITVDENGVISGSSAYTLPTATTSRLGGVKVDGSTITVDSDGTLHGASAIDNLSDIGDVNISSIKDKQALVWDSASAKWINSDVSSSENSDSYTDKEIIDAISSIFSINAITVGDLIDYLKYENNFETGHSGGYINSIIGDYYFFLYGRNASGTTDITEGADEIFSLSKTSGYGFICKMVQATSTQIKPYNNGNGCAFVHFNKESFEIYLDTIKKCPKQINSSYTFEAVPNTCYLIAHWGTLSGISPYWTIKSTEYSTIPVSITFGKATSSTVKCGDVAIAYITLEE